MFKLISTTEFELSFESRSHCQDDMIVSKFITEITKILSTMPFNDIQDLLTEDYDKNEKKLHISFEYNYLLFHVFIKTLHSDHNSLEDKLDARILYYEDKVLKQLYFKNNKQSNDFYKFKNIGEVVKNDLLTVVEEINNEILEELQRECHVEYVRDLHH